MQEAKDTAKKPDMDPADNSYVDVADEHIKKDPPAGGATKPSADGAKNVDDGAGVDLPDNSGREQQPTEPPSGAEGAQEACGSGEATAAASGRSARQNGAQSPALRPQLPARKADGPARSAQKGPGVLGSAQELPGAPRSVQ